MKELQFESVKHILSKLGDVSLFHYLTVDEKWKLLSLCEIFEYKPGEKIISQDEIGTCFYAILSGAVNVTVNEDNSNNGIFLTTIGSGDFFGENGIFSNSKRTANILAADTTEILRISRSNFFRFIHDYAPAGVKILLIFVNGLMKKLNDSNKEIVLERREVLNQSAIDQFLEELAANESEA